MTRCLVILKVTLVDPASGRIVIDGVDITTIGLHDLRSRVVSVQLECLSSPGCLTVTADLHTTGCHPFFWHPA